MLFNASSILFITSWTLTVFQTNPFWHISFSTEYIDDEWEVLHRRVQQKQRTPKDRGYGLCDNCSFSSPSPVLTISVRWMRNTQQEDQVINNQNQPGYVCRYNLPKSWFSFLDCFLSLNLLALSFSSLSFSASFSPGKPNY